MGVTATQNAVQRHPHFAQNERNGHSGPVQPPLPALRLARIGNVGSRGRPALPRPVVAGAFRVSPDGE